MDTIPATGVDAVPKPTEAGVTPEPAETTKAPEPETVAPTEPAPHPVHGILEELETKMHSLGGFVVSELNALLQSAKAAVKHL